MRAEMEGDQKRTVAAAAGAAQCEAASRTALDGRSLLGPAQPRLDAKAVLFGTDATWVALPILDTRT